MWHSKTLHHGTEQGLNGKTTLRFLTDVAHVLQDSWLHALFQGHAKAGTEISRVSICLEVRPNKIPEASNIKQKDEKRTDGFCTGTLVEKITQLEERNNLALPSVWNLPFDLGLVHVCILGYWSQVHSFLFSFSDWPDSDSRHFCCWFYHFHGFYSIYLNIQYHIKCCD